MEEEKKKEKMVGDGKQQLVIKPAPEPVQPFYELIEEEEEEDEQMRETTIILSEK